MSRTFELICLETKERLWIGQGRQDDMTVFYSGEPETMAKLQRFLNAHQGKTLRFVCADTTSYLTDDGWKHFEEPEQTRYGAEEGRERADAAMEEAKACMPALLVRLRHKASGPRTLYGGWDLIFDGEALLTGERMLYPWTPVAWVKAARELLDIPERNDRQPGEGREDGIR